MIFLRFTKKKKKTKQRYIYIDVLKYGMAVLFFRIRKKKKTVEFDTDPSVFRRRLRLVAVLRFGETSHLFINRKR